MKSRQLIHIDMDAFFAAVEARDNPALRNQPVLVGNGVRGVVCAASYEARTFGVRAAMPMSVARRRCPHGIVVAPRHARYAAVSRELFAIFARFTPLVEGLSLDEAFLDVTGSLALMGSAAHIAQKIQAAIRAEVGLSASAGVAPCKFVAKIASDLRKPGGLVVVPPDEVLGFLAPLGTERIWGVGQVGHARLQQAGFCTLGQLQSAAPAVLQQLFGDRGLQLRQLSCGEDARPVLTDVPAKSVSAENTFVTDLTDMQAIQRSLLRQSARVAHRLTAMPACGHTVQIKLKDAAFGIETRRLALHDPIADADSIYEAARTLLSRQPISSLGLRLTGVSVSALRKGCPPRLLVPQPHQIRRHALQQLAAQVTTRFGDHALTRASLLEH